MCFIAVLLSMRMILEATVSRRYEGLFVGNVSKAEGFSTYFVLQHIHIVVGETKI